MIYDDQKWMMRAREGTETYAVRRVVLINAFAAIDREALIEKAWRGNEGIMSRNPKIRAEAVLIAAGIIKP